MPPNKDKLTTYQKFKKFAAKLKKQGRKPNPKDPIVHYVMHRFHKDGDLHSGNSDRVVTDRKQAIAIALNMARRYTKKGKKKE